MINHEIHETNEQKRRKPFLFRVFRVVRGQILTHIKEGSPFFFRVFRGQIFKTAGMPSFKMV